MGYPTKYHNPRGQQIGCCICARKFSSSRYIKYNAKFSEELFCIVFQLKSMVGRRGYLCNPCVLVMKRYQKKLDAGVPPSELPNYSPRVDCCLKRGPKRQRCTQERTLVDDADDNDVEGDCGDNNARMGTKSGSKNQGYRQRELTLRPRFVYTGRKSIHLKSMHQLVPAQFCQESDEDEEEDDSSDDEMVKRRRTTLKPGRKTNLEKLEEKRKQDFIENQRLFGDPEEDPGALGSRAKHRGASIYKKPQRPFSTPQKVTTRRQMAKETGVIDAAGPMKGENDKKQLVEDTSDTTSALDGRPDPDEEEEPENSMDSSCFSGAVQNTAETDHTVKYEAGGELAANSSETTQSQSKSKGGTRMNLWNMEDKQSISKPLQEVEKKTESRDLSIDALEEELAPPPIKVSRVTRKPVRGLKPPSVSFIDNTYYQKFQLCCVPVYAGEGGMLIMDYSRRTPDCPKMHMHLERHQARLQRKRKTTESSIIPPQVNSAILRGELASSSPASTCSSDMSDGRALLIPSPTESSCANFQFCPMDEGSHASCC